MEESLRGIQRVVAGTAHSTKNHSRETGGIRRGENYRGRAREKGEGERGRGVHPRRMGKQSGEVSESDSG